MQIGSLGQRFYWLLPVLIGLGMFRLPQLSGSANAYQYAADCRLACHPNTNTVV
jgi:hypothetical protein